MIVQYGVKNMIINKTSDFIHYYHAVHSAGERTPRFLRRVPNEERGIDRIDISPEAMERLRRRNSSSLARAGFRLSLAIGELMMMAERSADTEQRQRIAELRDRVRNGSYNFDAPEVMAATGEAITGLMK